MLEFGLQSMTFRVFVPSTWLDLQEHREAARAAIRQIGAVDVAMEHLGARDELPKRESLRLVREESDIFIGIYAHRYGSVPEGDVVSITEAEYLEASSAGLTRLIYLVDDDAPWIPAHIDHGASLEKLARFKSHLRASHVCKRFSGKDDLAAAVAADLGREFMYKRMPHISPGEPEDPFETAPDWTANRNAIYREARNLFLAHTMRQSTTESQVYDIAIYLIPHLSNDPRYRRDDMSDVIRADFFLGAYWGNKVISVFPSDGRIGITTSAYGPFLCLCRVHFNGGATALLSRYVDFEMGPIRTQSHSVK